EPDCTRLENPGNNRQGTPIRALAIDSQFLCSPSVAAYKVTPRTHHKRKVATALFNEGSVRALNNRQGRYTLDLQNNADLFDAFNRNLRALEYADAEF